MEHFHELGVQSAASENMSHRRRCIMQVQAEQAANCFYKGSLAYSVGHGRRDISIAGLQLSLEGSRLLCVDMNPRSAPTPGHDRAGLMEHVKDRDLFIGSLQGVILRDLLLHNLDLRLLLLVVRWRIVRSWLGFTFETSFICFSRPPPLLEIIRATCLRQSMSTPLWLQVLRERSSHRFMRFVFEVLREASLFYSFLSASASSLERLLTHLGQPSRESTLPFALVVRDIAGRISPQLMSLRTGSQTARTQIRLIPLNALHTATITMHCVGGENERSDDEIDMVPGRNGIQLAATVSHENSIFFSVNHIRIAKCLYAKYAVTAVE
ncbi:hypothetical protein KC361_g178 [Hortaea werneckii]|nr:hypothetical protein KC361_g178 [Hortaea werneckii]